MTDHIRSDVVINGAGLAGLSAACALAHFGLSATLINPNAPGGNTIDLRTTALLNGSIGFLEQIGVWAAVRERSSPLTVMRIIDGTDRLFRAPQTDFVATEIGLDAFGYNVTNGDLVDALWDQVSRTEAIHFVEATSNGFDITQQHVRVETSAGTTVAGGFLIGADGRNSPVAEAIGVKRRTWNHRQYALVTNLSHTLPHQSVSTEFHTTQGPFTIVPMPGNNSSLVWVCSDSRCKALLEIPEREFCLLLEEKMHSILGKVTSVTKRQTFQLSSSHTDRLGLGRVALVGEAGHAMPPIGAQGFNLGLRDVREIVELLSSTGTGEWQGLGGQFHRSRQSDVISRMGSVDLLNRSLLSDFLPVQLARSAGLLALGAVGPLRRMVMQQGVG